MPYHGGGRPSLLTPDIIEPICAAIREGCYAKVAAGRVGIDGYTLATWDMRGQREVENRAERSMRGEPADEPASLYEQLHTALEQAKSEARYSAETRVFRAMPLHWLRSGYARNDWRESDQFVRAVEDAVEAKLRQLAEAQAANQTPGQHAPMSNEQLVAVLNDLMEVHALNQHPPQPTPERDQQNGHATPA